MAKVFGDKRIIACETGPMGQFHGITADGNTKSLGDFGSPIQRITNGSTHAVVTLDNGSRYLFDFKKETSRHL